MVPNCFLRMCRSGQPLFLHEGSALLLKWLILLVLHLVDQFIFFLCTCVLKFLSAFALFDWKAQWSPDSLLYGMLKQIGLERMWICQLQCTYFCNVLTELLHYYWSFIFLNCLIFLWDIIWYLKITKLYYSIYFKHCSDQCAY